MNEREQLGLQKVVSNLTKKLLRLKDTAKQLEKVCKRRKRYVFICSKKLEYVKNNDINLYNKMIENVNKRYPKNE